MASSQHGGCKGGLGGRCGSGRGTALNVNEEGFIKHFGKTFFDKKSLRLCNDLDNKSVIGLKYCYFDDFDGV